MTAIIGKGDNTSGLVQHNPEKGTHYKIQAQQTIRQHHACNRTESQGSIRNCKMPILLKHKGQCTEHNDTLETPYTHEQAKHWISLGQQQQLV